MLSRRQTVLAFAAFPVIAKPSSSGGLGWHNGVLMVQYIDLKSQYARLKDRIGEGISEVLEGGQYVLGPAVKNFEQEMSDYLGVRHSIGVSNGTDAIIMALLGM